MKSIYLVLFVACTVFQCSANEGKPNYSSNFSKNMQSQTHSHTILISILFLPILESENAA